MSENQIFSSAHFQMWLENIDSFKCDKIIWHINDADYLDHSQSGQVWLSDAYKSWFSHIKSSAVHIVKVLKIQLWISSPRGTIIAPSIVVSVDGAELGAPGRKTLAQVGAEAVVEDTVCSQCIGQAKFIDKKSNLWT